MLACLRLNRIYPLQGQFEVVTPDRIASCLVYSFECTFLAFDENYPLLRASQDGHDSCYSPRRSDGDDSR